MRDVSRMPCAMAGAMALAVTLSVPVLTAALRSPLAPVRAPVAERTVWDSVYTAEQARRGQTGYTRTCARCHMASLGGADQSPALTGSAFLSNWNGLTLGALHERIRKTMPSDEPGTYGRQLIADVLAYVLKVNGFPAGNAELPKESGALEQIRVQVARP